MGAAVLILVMPGGGSARVASNSDILGEPVLYVTHADDTLADLARDFDIGFIAMRAANPDVDPWLPGEGTALTVPSQHIIPAAPRRGIVINLPELRLYFFPRTGSPLTFPIGIGGEGKETPTGHTVIAGKRTHPIWIPTASEHLEDPDLPDEIGPGPDNPMGDYALYLGWKGYAIHGTNRPYSIGRRDSHGCIRMYPEDIEALYRAITIGTEVTIVDQPGKAGWSEDSLYLEVHADQKDAEALETEGRLPDLDPYDADDLVLRAAGDDTELDWPTIRAAEFERRGVVVPIGTRNR